VADRAAPAEYCEIAAFGARLAEMWVSFYTEKFWQESHFWSLYIRRSQSGGEGACVVFQRLASQLPYLRSLS
jgi:hypothetical protein